MIKYKATKDRAILQKIVEDEKSLSGFITGDAKVSYKVIDSQEKDLMNKTIFVSVEPSWIENDIFSIETKHITAYVE